MLLLARCAAPSGAQGGRYLVWMLLLVQVHIVQLIHETYSGCAAAPETSDIGCHKEREDNNAQ